MRRERWASKCRGGIGVLLGYKSEGQERGERRPEMSDRFCGEACSWGGEGALCFS